MPSHPPSPCQCGALTTRQRCPRCEARRNTTRPHYQGDYRQRAASVRQAANADPLTRCWRCGNTATPGDPWQAGHLTDGDPNSPLLPEHRSCNATAGANLNR